LAGKQVYADQRVKTRQLPEKLRATGLCRSGTGLGSALSTAKSNLWTANDSVLSAGGRQRKRHKSDKSAPLKSLRFLAQCFLATAATKQFSAPRNHFPLVVQMSGNSPWVS